MVNYLNEDDYDLLCKPLSWHLDGLNETAVGYGSKLTTSNMIRFHGEKRVYRVYCTCYGNVSSCWIKRHGLIWYLPGV